MKKEIINVCAIFKKCGTRIWKAINLKNKISTSTVHVMKTRMRLEGCNPLWKRKQFNF